MLICINFDHELLEMLMQIACMPFSAIFDKNDNFSIHDKREVHKHGKINLQGLLCEMINSLIYVYRICNIGLHDMMTAVVILKEFQKRGLITEVVKGVWLRSPGNQPGDSHGKLLQLLYLHSDFY